MTVYLDQLRNVIPTGRWPYASAAHLFADTEAELLAFGARIGLRPEWLQRRTGGPPRPPHFDVAAMKWQAALDAGAVLVNRRQSMEMFDDFANGRGLIDPRPMKEMDHDTDIRGKAGRAETGPKAPSIHLENRWGIHPPDAV